MTQSRKGGPAKHVADILGHMKSGDRNRMLEKLETHDAETAVNIRSLMFTFEDLIKIDAPGIQELLRHIDSEQLAIAMKGAPDNIRLLFLENMSDRAGSILLETIKGLGTVRMDDIETAHKAIVDTALSLAEAGTIIIRDGGDDVYIT